MLLDIPAAEAAWLIAALLAGGALTGVLAGVFGVGGGAVAVPILYELFRILGVPDEARMPLCIGTSLAIIIPTSLRSFSTHYKRGAVDMSILKVWAVPVVLGVIAGSFIARYAPADLFKLVFIGVAGISAIKLLFGRDSWRLGLDMPRRGLMRLYGGLIGVLSSLMGIGGGQLSSLFMTFYNRPIHQAVATSSGLGVIISIPGALGYIYAGWPVAAQFPNVAALQHPLALGYVSLIGFVLFSITSVITAPMGANLAHRLNKKRLETAFGVFLLLICLRFAVSLVLS
ncbi:sulfite exporter TauE/SafE family protein [Aureimonas fodinaquatilis]|uniref:Probable membrane transporter protein n=1 Tax=Aureimonas fodinaquatilis TaxID=2565783 RepID=A0A5B0DPA3_9HYPH|nr:sulfite exporter TauE/SafE family protein [Aureimonas fodinaquatilis]KAA0968594.1 sulfite exporter TauE/SafE family protein [Aureimonas fodinaquatilis]